MHQHPRINIQKLRNAIHHTGCQAGQASCPQLSEPALMIHRIVPILRSLSQIPCQSCSYLLCSYHPVLLVDVCSELIECLQRLWLAERAVWVCFEIIDTRLNNHRGHPNMFIPLLAGHCFGTTGSKFIEQMQDHHCVRCFRSLTGEGQAVFHEELPAG